jgi:streptogramin lyase
MKNLAAGLAAAVALTLAHHTRATVHVGSQPTGLASGAGSLWSANSAGGSVSRISPTRRKVVATIRVGTSPSSVAFGAGAVWVGDFTADALYRIDPATNKVVATISLHGPAAGIAAAPDGSMWVAEYSAGTVAHVDPATNAVIGRVSVGGDAEALAFAHGRLWITNGSGYITAVDPGSGKQVAKITLGRDVDAVVATPHGLWATTYYGGVVARIDPAGATVVRRLRLHSGGHASGVTFADGSVWVSDAGLDRVVRISAKRARITKSYAVGLTPRDLVQVGHGLWLVEQNSNDVRRIALPAG